MTKTRTLINEKTLMTKSPQAIRQLMNSRKNSPQERADDAVGTIIEAIQNIAFALDDASVAIMCHIPAKGAEPERGLDRLAGARKGLARALHLITTEMQPPGGKCKTTKSRRRQ
jgi:hypothetical protein